MKKLILSILLIAGVSVSAKAQFQPGLANGSSVSNFVCTAGTNWSPIALSSGTVFNRLINNTNTTSDLLVAYVLPVVSGSTQYTSFITSNLYNGSVIGLQTNIPSRAVVVATYGATLNYKVFSVAANTSTNIGYAIEAFGTYTNAAGTINTTNNVIVNDAYQQR